MIPIDEEALLLVGRQTLLRPFKAGDISAAYLDWLADEEVVRFSNQRFHKHTRESTLAYVNSFVGSDNLFLGILLAEDQRLVGTITAYRSVPHQTADMGIMVGDRSCWGKGIGLDAWSTLMHYLLYKCELRKVTGGTLRCNVGMVRIMERSGMQLEALRAKQELVDQVAQDVIYYAKFRDA